MSDLDDLILREFDEPQWCKRCVEYVSPAHRCPVCRLSIPLDVGPMAPNKLLRKHWSVRQKHARTTDQLAFAYWHKAGRPRAIGPVVVTYTVRRGRKLDNDGCLGALKFLTDGLFKNRITPDDAPEWVTFNPVVQIVSPKGKAAPTVDVLVEEI